MATTMASAALFSTTTPQVKRDTKAAARAAKKALNLQWRGALSLGHLVLIFLTWVVIMSQAGKSPRNYGWTGGSGSDQSAEPQRRRRRQAAPPPQYQSAAAAAAGNRAGGVVGGFGMFAPLPYAPDILAALRHPSTPNRRGGGRRPRLAVRWLERGDPANHLLPNTASGRAAAAAAGALSASPLATRAVIAPHDAIWGVLAAHAADLTRDTTVRTDVVGNAIIVRLYGGSGGAAAGAPGASSSASASPQDPSHPRMRQQSVFDQLVFASDMPSLGRPWGARGKSSGGSSLPSLYGTTVVGPWLYTETLNSIYGGDPAAAAALLPHFVDTTTTTTDTEDQQQQVNEYAIGAYLQIDTASESAASGGQLLFTITFDLGWRKNPTLQARIVVVPAAVAETVAAAA